MKIYTCEQRSDVWKFLHIGIPSASNFSKIITTTGKPSTQREKYLYQLVGERLSGTVEETYQNSAMKRGTELESEARALYEFTTGETVEQVGFCLDDGGRYGASPDGLIGEKGLLEIKCPMVSTHIGYLLDGGLPSEYFQQVQGQLLVTEREYVDFFSYFPAIKPLKVRVKRNEPFINSLRSELEKFCNELDEIVRKIKGD